MFPRGMLIQELVIPLMTSAVEIKITKAAHYFNCLVVNVPRICFNNRLFDYAKEKKKWKVVPLRKYMVQFKAFSF